MSAKQRLYWVSQLCGWLSYVVLMALLLQLDGGVFNSRVFFNLTTAFILGVLISEVYRKAILKLNWLRLKIVQLIPRVFTASFVLGAIYILFHTLITEFFVGNHKTFNALEMLQSILNLAVIFMLWSLLYFLFHFIRNYRQEEIKNLKLQSLQNEMELNRLKSQLNPHFIFNSMNSIRALIEENPNLAKEAVTSLSNILRNLLLMERKKIIPFAEELKLVHDYVNLEKCRYEERLKLHFEIEENTLTHSLPPMILQTVVENGIKHGISKLAEGGELKIIAELREGNLHLEVYNSGQLIENNKSEGFGVANTIERLKLLYTDSASFSLQNKGTDLVVAKLIIPAEKYLTNNDRNDDINN